MGEIRFDLLDLEASHLIPEDESMPKGLVRRQGESAIQFGKADQDQGQPGLVVHPEIEQQAQIVEHAVAQKVSFVDDEDGVLLFFGQHFGNLPLHRSPGVGPTIVFRQGELSGNGVESVQARAGGKGDVEHRMPIGRKTIDDNSAGDGFAAAGFTRDQSDASSFYQVLEPRGRFEQGTARKRLEGLNRRFERQKIKSEERFVPQEGFVDAESLN